MHLEINGMVIIRKAALEQQGCPCTLKVWTVTLQVAVPGTITEMEEEAWYWGHGWVF